MKTTLPYIKQMYNAKAYADGSLALSAIPANTFAIYDIDAGATVAIDGDPDTLPANFMLINKVGDKVYSSGAIKKASINNISKDTYSAPTVNIWETVIEHCDCLEDFKLLIFLDDQKLINQNGLSWANADAILGLTPEELKCACNCAEVNAVYGNNVMTKFIADKVNNLNSDYYEARILIKAYASLSNASEGITLPTEDLTAGDIFGITTTGVVSYYTGSEWIVIGIKSGTSLILTDPDTVTAFFKTVNTDDTDGNEGPKYTLQILSKIESTPNYKDLESNYIYPRGVRLTPYISVNKNEVAMPFTEVQNMSFELGAGYDLRAEEFECMSLYSNLNFYPQLSDGLAAADLVYQFENGKNYTVVSFDFYTDKTNGVSDGDKRTTSVLIGIATSGAGTPATLLNMFV